MGINRQIDNVERIDGLEPFLSDAAIDVAVAFAGENFLLVGSDTREGLDPTSDDAGGFGTVADVSGRRSDTLMLLRIGIDGQVAMMSVPRDLWVEISGTGESGRINGAYNGGPERLLQTIADALGIPVNHYVEVDFTGFREIVDSIGGVEICVQTDVRDLHTGLAMHAGCQTLDGAAALAFARSRYYEIWDGSDWETDPRGDLGRIERQQILVLAAVDQALINLQSSPFRLGVMMRAVTVSIRVDQNLNVRQAIDVLRRAVAGGVRTFALPVDDAKIGTNQVLVLASGSADVLAYFRGVGPLPVASETSAAVAGDS